jgi:putative transposon-encoded protein
MAWMFTRWPKVFIYLDYINLPCGEWCNDGEYLKKKVMLVIVRECLCLSLIMVLHYIICEEVDALQRKYVTHSGSCAMLFGFHETQKIHWYMCMR